MSTPSVWGVAGSPVDHSVTPMLFDLVGRSLGIASNSTITIDTENIDDVISFIQSHDGDAWISCTSPLKHSLHQKFPLKSRGSSSLNQIARIGGSMAVRDTDGAGFLEACWGLGITPSDHSLMIRGGGSTARSISLAWTRKGGYIVPVEGRRPLPDGPWSTNVLIQERADVGIDLDADPGRRKATKMPTEVKLSVSYDVNWNADDFAIRMLAAQHLDAWRYLFAPNLSDQLPTVENLLIALEKMRGTDDQS